MKRSITSWKCGFYELLGMLYQQDVEELQRLCEADERVAQVVAQGFLEFAFGPSMLEQAIEAGLIVIGEALDGSSTMTVVDDIPGEPPTPEQREELRAWCTTHTATRKNP